MFPVSAICRSLSFQRHPSGSRRAGERPSALRFGRLPAGVACIVVAVLAWSGPVLAQYQSPEATIAVVPLATIYPGDTIDDSMVVERKFNQLRPVRGGYAASAAALSGKVARRTLMPGVAIPVNAVENAKLVQKGVPTQLVFQDGSLTIMTLVSPLTAGELDESIRARNLDSGIIVYGIVQANGTLLAPGG